MTRLPHVQGGKGQVRRAKEKRILERPKKKERKKSWTFQRHPSGGKGQKIQLQTSKGEQADNFFSKRTAAHPEGGSNSSEASGRKKKGSSGRERGPSQPGGWGPNPKKKF